MKKYIQEKYIYKYKEEYIKKIELNYYDENKKYIFIKTTKNIFEAVKEDYPFSEYIEKDKEYFYISFGEKLNPEEIISEKIKIEITKI